MAVRLEGSIRRYVGLATDAKPRPYALGGRMAEGEVLPIGSAFYEIDTGAEHRWDGGQWFELPNIGRLMQEQIRLGAAILERLAEIQALLDKTGAAQ